MSPNGKVHVQKPEMRTQKESEMPAPADSPAATAPPPEIKLGRILKRDDDLLYIVLGVRGQAVDTVDFEGDLCTLPIADVALDLEHMRSPLLDSLSDQIAAGLDRYAPLRFYRSTSPNTAADDRVRVNWWKGSERPDLIRVGITVRVSGGQDDEGMCVTAIGNSEVLLSSPEGSSSASLEEIEVAEVLGAPPIAISPAPQGEGAPMDLQRFHELCSQLAAMVGDYFPSPSEKDAEIVVAIEGQVIRTNAISGLDTRELRDEVSGLLFKAERLTGCAYTNLYEERGKTPANQ